MTTSSEGLMLMLKHAGDALFDRAEHPVALVLSGGNALAAYQAGAYQALLEAGIEPDWIVGGSAGALNASLIAGNRAEDRIARLRRYWQVEAPRRPAMPWTPTSFQKAEGAGDMLRTLMFGYANAFAPRAAMPWAAAGPPALFDTEPMIATLRKLVDFDRLNRGPMRVTMAATDVESGEEVVFDTGAVQLTPEHVRASSAMIPLFPAVEIGGRRYVDAGLSANLPLDPVLSSPPAKPRLCLAIDLMADAAAPPATVDEAIGRAHDLVFASQSRRTIARYQREYAQAGENGAGLTLVHLVYRQQDAEIGGKALDFSASSIERRWARGQTDMGRLLERLASGEIRIAGGGLAVHRASV